MTGTRSPKTRSPKARSPKARDHCSCLDRGACGECAPSKTCLPGCGPATGVRTADARGRRHRCSSEWDGLK
jgi:hypothetical protein